MAGNVSEWVLDVYRPLTFEDMADFNPFRGNVFMNKARDTDGFLAEKDSLGRIRYVPVTDEESATRPNYRKAYNVNYRDGDFMSSIQTDWLNDPSEPDATGRMYDFGGTTLISDQSRVYKGGSWADRAYWMSPGTRRYLDENEAASTIGFRCAMNKVGGSFSRR
jgi:formylglycine-generating enzyme required for sulfatase activity